MKFIKPHFWYHKSQRNGVFFLLFIIVILQVIYSFVNVSAKENVFNDKELEALKLKIDSIKIDEIDKRKLSIYPFNPNYLTDYRAAQLGISIDEIDKLIAFRNGNKFINSKEEFQRVTKVSDSLLNKISPYFKFPDWVVKQSKAKTTQVSQKNIKVNVTTTDINLATISDLQSISGVTKYLAERIVKYRERLQGFTFKDQLLEVWKLDNNLSESILSVFSIKNRPIIQKLNINTASFKEVLSNPYIDFDLCKKIFAFRDEVAELQSIEELKNIEGFPLGKYDRIILYLEAK